jgi:hypothetical protein
VSKKIAKQSPATLPGGNEPSQSEVGASTSVENITRHEEIARLAYSLWQARGCPVGSPETDWFRAEQEMEPARSAAA